DKGLRVNPRGFSLVSLLPVADERSLARVLEEIGRFESAKSGNAKAHGEGNVQDGSVAKRYKAIARREGEKLVKLLEGKRSGRFSHVSILARNEVRMGRVKNVNREPTLGGLPNHVLVEAAEGRETLIDRRRRSVLVEQKVPIRLNVL